MNANEVYPSGGIQKIFPGGGGAQPGGMNLEGHIYKNKPQIFCVLMGFFFLKVGPPPPPGKIFWIRACTCTQVG